MKDGDIAARIDALPPLRQLVESMDMRARKSLGQNFLFDLNLTRKIARSAGPLTGTTIEIGPGPGGLTRVLLLEGAAHVIAIEKDRRASAVLSSLSMAAGERLTLIEADALTSPIWDIGTAPRRIIANLPYNIATTLLIRWLKHANCFDQIPGAKCVQTVVFSNFFLTLRFFKSDQFSIAYRFRIWSLSHV